MRRIGLIALCLSPLASFAGGEPDALFRSDEVIDVTLSAPLTTFLKQRSREEYAPGTFEYVDEAGESHSVSVQIRARGHFRHANCDFPPVRLNFKKSEVKDTLFDHQDKVKLVVHCKSADRYEQGVLREYLAYRVLNLLTDRSFRTRLFRVTYRDTEGKRDDQTRFAFLIEHKSRLGKRMGLDDLELEGTEVANIRPAELNLTSLLQFYLGNTDFSPVAGAPDRTCCHNYVLFGDKDDVDMITAIPYDFDQSGFVNAPYAGANPRFRLRSVRQRLYRGRCVNNEHIADSVQRFQDEREEILALLEAYPHISNSTRKTLVRYTGDFYGLIDKPERVRKYLTDKCI